MVGLERGRGPQARPRTPTHSILYTLRLGGGKSGDTKWFFFFFFLNESTNLEKIPTEVRKHSWVENSFFLKFLAPFNTPLPPPLPPSLSNSLSLVLFLICEQWILLQASCVWRGEALILLKIGYVGVCVYFFLKIRNFFFHPSHLVFLKQVAHKDYTLWTKGFFFKNVMILWNIAKCYMNIIYDPWVL